MTVSCLRFLMKMIWNWITLELDEDDCQLPPVSDEDDLELQDGDIVRNISVNIRFYEGWDE